MTHVTCWLTAENRDQLRNPTLGNRVWASLPFLPIDSPFSFSATHTLHNATHNIDGHEKGKEGGEKEEKKLCVGLEVTPMQNY